MDITPSEDQRKLAQLLKELYVLPHSSFFRASNGSWIYVKAELTFENLVDHLSGKYTLGLPAAFKAQAKWITADLDQPGLDQVVGVRRIFESAGFHPVASFSGDKGYHVTAFLDGPTPIDVVVRAARELQSRFETAGLRVCKVSPTAPSLQNMKLPLGLHPRTRNRCRLVDSDLNFVDDPIAFLSSVQRTHLQGDRAVNTVTGEVLALTPPPTASWEWPRACLKVLWETGLQRSHTRHSVTCSLICALIEMHRIADGEQLLYDWCDRFQPEAQAKGLTTTSLDYWRSEVHRFWRVHNDNPRFLARCGNNVLRSGMRSACVDEVACILEHSGHQDDMTLLTTLGVFNHGSASIPGLGKSALAVYQAAARIRDNSAPFMYEGQPAFALPKTAVVERAGVSRSTAKSCIRRLEQVGLLVRVPPDKVPHDVRARAGRRGEVITYYLLQPPTSLSQDALAQVIQNARQKRRRQ